MPLTPIQQLALDFYRQKEREADVAQLKAKYRVELLDAFYSMVEEHRLRIEVVMVPVSFFETTEMLPQDFLESRFPGFDLIDTEIEESQWVFTLKQKKNYLPVSVEADNEDGLIVVSKQVASGSPSIDWDTLKKEFPDYFRRLAVPQVSYEVDEDELQVILLEDPEFITKLRRHTRISEPKISIVPRKKKKKNEE